MNRGELWIAAGGSDYAGKPRPVVILQDNRLDETPSVTVCGLTTDQTSASLFRIPLSPSPGNGLKERCDVMVDKITTIRRDRLHRRIGFHGDADMQQIGRAVVVFLGMAR
ncbi:MAG: type II toxin-antitoxin system PemK/MazF family toxin [Alphaproteobacteria bacterium]|nr:type II toxin-antitoxin system PemK/MazF family toxin [Alphaproteobacteria bacterium]